MIPAIKDAITYWSAGLRGEPAKRYARVIGYGALGKSAKSALKHLEDSRFYPDTFWDAAAEQHSEIDGKPVSPPDFESLTDDDLVVILPKSEAAKHEIMMFFKANSIKNYLFVQNIKLKPRDFFPELYENCRFNP